MPARVVWGHEYVFGFDGDDLGVNSSIHVEMASPAGSKPFFTGNVGDLSQRLFIRLDRGDPPAQVTATYEEEEASDSLDDTFCSRTLVASVRGTSARSALPHVYFPSRCIEPRYRPRHLIVACGDGGLYVSSIHWHNWNGSSAVGRGTAHLNDCTPDCADGHFHTYGIVVRAYRARYCLDVDKWQYSRLAYHYVGAVRPPYQGAKGVPFPCGGV